MRAKQVTLEELVQLVSRLQAEAPFRHNGLRFGGVIEVLIEQIGWMGGKLSIWSDQWFKVVAEGIITDADLENERQFSCEASNESLLLCVLRVYLKWREAWQSLNQRSSQPLVFTIIDE